MLPNQIPAAAPEVVALGSALNDVLTAVKGGKTWIEAIQSAEGDALAAATSGISNLGTDIKQAHNQVYLGWSVASVYETP